MKRAWTGVWFLLALYFSAAAAYGQTGSRVTGTVQDKSGGVVTDAKVTLTNEATNVSVETTTTSTGAYVFDGIAPGTYTVTIVANNFSTYETKGNVLTIAQAMVVNVVLQVGQ